MIPERIYRQVAPHVHSTIARLGWHRSTLAAPIEVRHQRVDLGWGMRIVVASDLHVDADFFPRERVRAVVDLVNSLDDVDLVAMPGDFVGHDAVAIEWAAAELARIEAPVYATLGNHDHMTDPECVVEALEAAGVHVVTGVAEPFGDVWVVGMESRYAREPQPGDVDDLVPEGAEALVIGHEPTLANHHSQRLHIAGHTHHGQVRVRNRPVVLPSHSRPFAAGLATVYGPTGDRHVYTTAGLGTTTVPIRIGVPPEIVVIDC